MLFTDASESLVRRVGHTSMIPLSSLSPGADSGVTVLAKAEWENPSGSVKDRPALGIIRAALREGKLVRGTRLLDSTSGNMGISYAMLCAPLGIPVTLVVPASASPERLAMLRALGAEVILTDPSDGSDGAIVEARRLANEMPERYWYACQYDNPANWQAHYESTGPEILRQTEGRITHLVAGIGTSGTLMGVGRYLREHNPAVRIIGVQPDAGFHGLEGLKHLETAILPGIYETNFADDCVAIRTEDARAMVRRLARQQGLLVGISSGAAALAALNVARSMHEGVVVAIFADSGMKYLSDESLWRDR